MTAVVGGIIRQRLADELLTCRSTVDILRLEALSARLSPAIGAKFVLHRCLSLRRFLRPLSQLGQLFFWPPSLVTQSLPTIFRLKSHRERLSFSVPPMAFGFLLMVFLVLLLVLIPRHPFYHYPKKLPLGNILIRAMLTKQFLWRVFALSIVWALGFLILLGSYLLRAEGCKLGFSYFFPQGLRVLRTACVAEIDVILIVATTILVYALFGISTDLLSIWIGYGALEVPQVGLSGGIVLLLLLCVVTASISISERKRMIELHHFEHLGLSGVDLVLQARSVAELRTWLGGSETLLRGNITDIRSTSRLLLATSDGWLGAVDFSNLFRSVAEGTSLIPIDRELEQRLAEALGQRTIASPLTSLAD